VAEPQLNSDSRLSDDSTYPAGRGSLIQACLPYVALLAACYFLGLYCCELNKQLYQHTSPFYDSLSYNERLFRVMTVSRQDGLVESLDLACFSNNTNCLPFLVATVIASIVEPSRLVGVWFQTGLLFVFLASLYHYLSSIRLLSTSSSLAGCFVFFAASLLYFENGGLSDFRMDLSLFIGFGLTSLWYLSSMSRLSGGSFVLLGISGASCCLLRATAPVYLIFSLAPLFLCELLKPLNRGAKLRGIVISATLVVVLAGWFYILNFDYLRYYYIDWNTDANAKIPFSEAIDHWKFAHRGIGEPVHLILILWWIGVAMGTLKKQSLRSWIWQSIRSGDIDWRIGWLGFAPVVMMVARRAGLNPFVCLPAVFGLILFISLPCLGQLDLLKDKVLVLFCWVVLLICVGIACARGWKRHSPDEFSTIKANHLIIDTILDNARSRNKTRLQYGVVQTTKIDANTLYSVLLFDRPDAKPYLDGVVIDGVNIRRGRTFSRPAQLDWDMLPGSTDEEKIAGMIAEAGAKIDFLILPDRESAKTIPLQYGYNVINNHLLPLRQLITNNESWALLKSGVQVDEKEYVDIYRNLNRD